MSSLAIIPFAFSVYFWFYVLNHTDIASGWRKWLTDSSLHDNVKYALACSLCFTFHVTTLCFLFSAVPFYWIMVAPVINLLLDRVLVKP